MDEADTGFPAAKENIISGRDTAVYPDSRYLTQLQSVRGITFKFNQDEAIENIANLLGCEMEEMFHHDTLTYFLERLAREEIEELRYKIVYHLIRGRYFKDF